MLPKSSFKKLYCIFFLFKGSIKKYLYKWTFYNIVLEMTKVRVRCNGTMKGEFIFGTNSHTYTHLIS